MKPRQITTSVCCVALKGRARATYARQRHGFTLVEMLAASALMALLAVAVLRSVTGLAGAKKRPGVLDETGHISRVVRWDLANASGILPNENGAVLESQGPLPAAGRMPSHQPVRVSYRIVPIGGVRWLVREQTAADPSVAGVSGASGRELVCGGVKTFSIQPLSREGYRVRLTWTDPGRMPLDEAYIAR